MTELWNIRAEIIVQPEDFLPPIRMVHEHYYAGKFCRSCAGKIASYFKRFEWLVIGVEEARVLLPNFVADDDEFQDVFEHARNNPDAIICGTFHSFKSN